MARRHFILVREPDGYRLNTVFVIKELAKQHAEHLYRITGRVFQVVDAIKS